MEKRIMYLIERGGDYYSSNGFWRINVYAPHFYNSREDAQQEINGFDSISSEYCKIIPVTIEL